MIRSKIISAGGFLPKKTMSSGEFSSILDTSEEWIVTRTGIKNRHIASDHETLNYMSESAARDAIKYSDLDPALIDIIIVATSTPDKTFPSCSTSIQRNLGCVSSFAFDVQAACSGFIFALSIADSYIKSGVARNVLVVGADKMSSLIDWKDRSTSILFGDGAGAMILSATSSQDSDSGVLSCCLYSDGSYGDILNTSGGVSSNGVSGNVVMNGRLVFEQGIKKMYSAAIEIMRKESLTIEDIDLVIPHQANMRLISSLSKMLSCPEHKMLVSVESHANTSAASIPLAWCHGRDRIKKGMLVLFLAFGAGINWGSVLVRV